MESPEINSWPLLLPGVVNVSTRFGSSPLLDPVIRLRETRESLFWFIKSQLFSKIVLVDGSNVPLLSQDEIAAIKDTANIAIEQILFQQDIARVSEYGKSYGECTLIDHAIANSSLIGGCGGFVKLTARYYVSNIKDVLRCMFGENVFFSSSIWPITIASPYVCTAFYRMTSSFYGSTLSAAAGLCKDSGPSLLLEEAYYHLLRPKSRTSFSCPYPFFAGTAGTTGRSISNSKYTVRNLASKFGLLSHTYSE